MHPHLTQAKHKAGSLPFTHVKAYTTAWLTVRSTSRFALEQSSMGQVIKCKFLLKDAKYLLLLLLHRMGCTQK